jgi:HEAT repeat protein
VASTLFCPDCQLTVTVETGTNTSNCPRCRAELSPRQSAAAPGNAPAAEVAWWVSGPNVSPPTCLSSTSPAPAHTNGAEKTASTAVLPEPAAFSPAPGPRLEPPRPTETRPPRPASSATDVGPWGGLAVALGLLSFGICWLPRLAIFGIALSCLGLLLALIGLLVLLVRREPGSAFPLTASAVCLQALVLASVFTLQPERAALRPGDDLETDHKQPPGKPLPRNDQQAVREVLEAVRGSDPATRREALNTLGELAAGVADVVPVLAEALTDKNPEMRTVAARALGQIGPLARGAYPALLHSSKNDEAEAPRQAALDALARLGKPTAADVPGLIDGLKASSPTYRAAVAQTLSFIGPDVKPAVPALREALKDADPRVRLYAAQSLWAVNRRAEEVLEVYQGLLRNQNDAGLRSAAAFSLGSLEADARPAMPSLKQAVKDPDPDVRLYAAQTLWALDHKTIDQVLPVFREALTSSNVRHQTTAVEVLARIGPEARSTVPLLRELLKSDEAELRALAAFALASIGPDAASAVEDLARLAQAREGQLAVREQAVYALANIGPKAVKAVPALMDLLRDPNLNLRGRAALALGAIGPAAQPAVGALADALADNTDPTIKLFAAQALWVIDKKEQMALPVLCDLLTDDQISLAMRLQAVKTLTQMGSSAKAAFPALHRAGFDDNEALQKAIEIATEQIGRPAKEDVPALVAALESPNVRFRTAAAQTLWLIGPDAREAVPGLIDAFNKQKDASLRQAVVEALGSIGPEARMGVPILIEALQAKPLELRLAAAQAIGALGVEAKAAVRPLLDGLKEKEVDLQAAILDALAAMGPAAKEAVDPVAALLADKDAKVRETAAFALGAIGKDALRTCKALDELLKDQNELVRVQAAQALWVINQQTKGTIPVLIESLGNKEPALRATAAATLAQMGPAAREALEPLQKALKAENNEETRKAMQEAVKRIDPGAKQK